MVQQGSYKDESDYVRDLVRRDEEKNREFLMTKAAIQEGLDSGFSNRGLDEIWLQAEKNIQIAKMGKYRITTKEDFDLLILHPLPFINSALNKQPAT